MQSLLPFFVPLALRIMAYAFEKNYLDAEQKRAFLDFVQSMGARGNSSKKAMDIFFKLHENLKGKE